MTTQSTLKSFKLEEHILDKYLPYKKMSYETVNKGLEHKARICCVIEVNGLYGVVANEKMSNFKLEEFKCQGVLVKPFTFLKDALTFYNRLHKEFE